MLIVSLIVFQVVFFLGLVLMLRKIMTQNVISATKHLEELSQEYAKKEQEIEKLREEAEAKAQEIEETARKTAEEEKQRSLNETEEKRGRVLSEAQEKASEIIQKADKTRLALIADIEGKIEEKATQRGAELLKYVLPEDMRKNMHVHLLNDFFASASEKMGSLQIAENITEVKMTTAFALTEKEKNLLFEKLKAKTGKDFRISEEIDSGLIAGFLIAIGNLVLDDTLRFKIKERAQELINQRK